MHSIFITYFMLTLFSVYIIKKWNDYVPFVICLGGISFTARYVVLSLGLADFVNYDYGITIIFSQDLALRAINYISIGLFILWASYVYFRQYGKIKWINKIYDDQILNIFLNKHKSVIIFSLIFSQLANTFFGVRAYFIEGIKSSYVLYLPFMASSAIILSLLLLKNRVIRDPAIKLLILGLIVINIPITVLSGQRFVAIAWVVVILLLFSVHLKFRYKLLGLILLPFVGLIALTFLGLNRYTWFSVNSFTTQLKLSFDAALVFSDFNMVDGMMMVLNVFPKYLNYFHGMGHIEIILRAIPRQLWPGKPVGGWAQKLAIESDQDLFGTGFGSSLIGDFYTEFSDLGVIILPILYGFFIAKLMSYAERYSSDFRIVLQSVIAASLIPLLRGGDLPGIYSLIILIYWPIILFDFQYKNFIKRHLKSMNPFSWH